MPLFGPLDYVDAYTKKYFEARREEEARRAEMLRQMAPGCYEIHESQVKGAPAPGQAVYAAKGWEDCDRQAVYNENLKRWVTREEYLRSTDKPKENMSTRYSLSTNGYYVSPMGQMGKADSAEEVGTTFTRPEVGHMKFFASELVHRALKTKFYLLWEGTGRHYAKLYTVGVPVGTYADEEVRRFQGTIKNQADNTIELLVKFIQDKYPDYQPKEPEWIVCNKDLGEKITCVAIPDESYKDPDKVKALEKAKKKSQKEADKRRRKATNTKKPKRGIAMKLLFSLSAAAIIGSLIAYSVFHWNTSKWSLQLADQGVSRTYSHSVSFLRDSIGVEFKQMEGIPGVLVRTDLGWTVFDSEDEYEQIVKAFKQNGGRFSVKYDKLTRKTGVKSILAKKIGEEEWADSVKEVYIIRVLTFYENKDPNKFAISQTEYRLNLAARFRERENLHLDDRDRFPLWELGSRTPVWGEIRQHGKPAVSPQ